MPSIDHQGPLQLLENAPDLAPFLLRARGIAVPDYCEARIAHADFSQLVPTEYRADDVVTLWAGRKQPEMGIVCEMQVSVDRRKKYTWPLYTAALRAEIEGPTCLLVLTLEDAVARWAREAITDLQPGCAFVPVVLGPAEMPWVRSIEEARAAPELAVLSAMAHANEAGEGGLEVAAAAVIAAAGLDEERKALYADLVFRSLSADNFKKLVSLMNLRDYQPQSDFAKTWHGKGKAEGKAEGKAAVLLRFFVRRFGYGEESLAGRIRAETRCDLLDAWLDDAMMLGDRDAMLELAERIRATPPPPPPETP